MRGLKKPFQKLTGNTPEEEDFWALRNVSFTVDEGEVVGIIGRNGAGKSTLLKLLSRITRPTEGSAKLFGRVGSLLEVGTGFHPELTGRENIFLSGTLLGMTRAEVRKKFDEIVDFSGVEKFIDTPVKHYSSGMYVRLGFAIAAHLEPEILLVDEVLAVGDMQFQKKCLGKMDEVAKSGRTVLFVSHNMGAIKNICTNTFVIDNGNICYTGLSSEAVEKYLCLCQKETCSNKKENAPEEMYINLKDHSGRKIDTLEAGGELLIEVTHSECSIADKDSIGVWIIDENGNKITFLETLFLPEDNKTAENWNKTVFKINRWSFAPSTYTFTLTKNRWGEGCMYTKENICKIDILPGDFYNSGFILTPKHGTTYIQASYEKSQKEKL
jgi:lipopolysaccharide transport system ATP-binding protein